MSRHLDNTSKQIIANVISLCDEEARKRELNKPIHLATFRAEMYTGYNSSTIERIRRQIKKDPSCFLKSQPKKRQRSSNETKLSKPTVHRVLRKRKLDEDQKEAVLGKLNCGWDKHRWQAFAAAKEAAAKSEPVLCKIQQEMSANYKIDRLAVDVTALKKKKNNAASSTKSANSEDIALKSEEIEIKAEPYEEEDFVDVPNFVSVSEIEHEITQAKNSGNKNIDTSNNTNAVNKLESSSKASLCVDEILPVETTTLHGASDNIATKNNSSIKASCCGVLQHIDLETTKCINDTTEAKNLNNEETTKSNEDTTTFGTKNLVNENKKFKGSKRSSSSRASPPKIQKILDCIDFNAAILNNANTIPELYPEINCSAPYQPSNSNQYNVGNTSSYLRPPLCTVPDLESSIPQHVIKPPQIISELSSNVSNLSSSSNQYPHVLNTSSQLRPPLHPQSTPYCQFSAVQPPILIPSAVNGPVQSGQHFPRYALVQQAPINPPTVHPTMDSATFDGGGPAYRSDPAYRSEPATCSNTRELENSRIFTMLEGIASVQRQILVNQQAEGPEDGLGNKKFLLSLFPFISSLPPNLNLEFRRDLMAFVKNFMEKHSMQRY